MRRCGYHFDIRGFQERVAVGLEPARHPHEMGYELPALHAKQMLPRAQGGEVGVRGGVVGCVAQPVHGVGQLRAESARVATLDDQER